MTTLKEIVKEASRQKFYLDRLISLVIEESPWLLDQVNANFDETSIDNKMEEFCWILLKVEYWNLHIWTALPYISPGIHVVHFQEIIEENMFDGHLNNLIAICNDSCEEFLTRFYNVIGVYIAL